MSNNINSCLFSIGKGGVGERAGKADEKRGRIVSMVISLQTLMLILLSGIYGTALC